MQETTFHKYFFFTGSVASKLRILVLGLFLFVFFYPVTVVAANPFPLYPVISKNVQFWEKIYSQYSTSQAVVHDSNNLGIVYEVLPIFSHRLPGASKINRPLLKGIKNKYTHILNQLAKGATPKTRDEKRVAALFGKSSRKRFQKAADSVRIQIGQKDRFLDGVIRSGAYMAQIRKIFAAQGLPTDLAYLPHVESSFNINAYSKFGASGIWQFTRSTGKQYLTINYVVDERQDPILASHAAAKFLKKNHTLLGSWPLALTAYNYGPAGMARAKKAHLSYEKIFKHYEKGHFKFASRNFYSEFLAAIRVAKRLERDPSVRKHAPRATLSFVLAAYISAPDICRHFSISEQTLKKYNPALRRSVLQGKKYIPRGYTLLLPYTNQHKIRVSKIPGRIYHKAQKPTKFHRVRAGDTAGKIAERYKVSLKSLRRTNNLDKNAAIFVGQNLRIPDTFSKSRPTKPSKSSKQKYSSQQKTSTTGIRSNSVPVLTATKKQKPAWKNIQKARSVILGELGVQKMAPGSNKAQGTIKILPNESLDLLAGWLKISVTELRTLNNFSKNRILQPDENFKINLKKVSAKQFEEKRFDFHLETEEDFFNAYKIIGVTSYKVNKGDTIWEISRKKFDIPLWLLKKYNSDLDFSKLRLSQRLTIPIVKAI